MSDGPVNQESDVPTYRCNLSDKVFTREEFLAFIKGRDGELRWTEETKWMEAEEFRTQYGERM